jgi:glycerophosphoryl diester phosphodiesterase
MTRFIQHAANLDPTLPPGSLAALENCLKSGIDWVEVDIIPLQGEDFALLHEPKLETISDGLGDVFEKSADEVQKLTYRPQHNWKHGLPLGTLSQAVRLMGQIPSHTFLQLDLKPYAPLSPQVLHGLLDLIAPIKERIMISCTADWAVRQLRKMDAGIRLGFDPLLYLDIAGNEPRPEGVPPFHKGAFGYLDDHPLAVQRWGRTGDYFALRAEALLCQAPRGVTWFLNAQLLTGALDAGFNWIAYLNENESLVDAWTIDLPQKDLAERLIEDGIDLITSNDANFLAEQIQIL